MKAEIHPSVVTGSITAPASKSAMQRACAAALLTKGTTHIKNPGHSNDDEAVKNILRQLGCTLEEKDDTLTIHSNGLTDAKATALSFGESGLASRMLIPIIALMNTPVVLNGSGSLVQRPMNFFDEILPLLNVQIQSNSGKLPIWLQGPLVPKNITIDGSLSSQFLTGLLMAFSGAGAADVTIHVNDLKSKPYIDLTLKLMQAFGMKLPQNNAYQSFYFDDSPVPENKKVIDYTVEGDWSGGAFLLVAGAISGSLTVRGLDPFSSQADKAVLQVLHSAEANMSVQSDEILIKESNLKAFHFNATDCPDLFPPLVALAAYCAGTSVIEGVSRLTHKESNRALTLQEEFEKLGVPIQLQDNLMLIEGGHTVQSAAVHSRHDHRIAMACAVAALKATGNVHIEEADAVNKSYPLFWQHLQQIGVALTLT